MKREYGFYILDAIDGSAIIDFKKIEEAEEFIKRNPSRYELIEDYSCYDNK